jgi:SAM-dependent methyltransferase
VYPLSERTARFLCRGRRPASALDLACASGFLVEALRAQGIPAVVGLDISLHAVTRAEPAQRGRLVVGDAQAGLPFRSEACELITACDLFEHLADPDRALREIRRVLRDGGQAYLKICHPRHPNAHRDPSHVNVQPLGYWRRAFRRSGFACTRVYEAEFTPEPGLRGLVVGWVRRWREWAVIGTPADYKFLLRKPPHA